MLFIQNHQTGEIARLDRDGRTVHPAWVHDQLGTDAESDLQYVLDECDLYEFAKRPGQRDEAGIFMPKLDADEFIAERAADEADSLMNSIDTGWTESMWYTIGAHYDRLGLTESDLGLLVHHMNGTEDVRDDVVAMLERLQSAELAAAS